ncbi:hypothetical protein [Lysinibacillus fusiformis]|uniref:hypothetical protein n=1 Tax=Lysinibacillus fusiformis TaxID=28031 RepID=UPI00046819A2|nr:hypothetical protein [Lysinibacillus fusiformis]
MAEVGSHDYEYVEAGTIDVKDLPPLDVETNKIMKDEFTTGLGLSVFYFILIFSIPVMNWFAPAFAFKKMWGGMTVTWFVTTVVMMAMAFIIAYVHTAMYEKRLKKYDLANK